MRLAGAHADRSPARGHSEKNSDPSSRTRRTHQGSGQYWFLIRAVARSLPGTPRSGQTSFDPLQRLLFPPRRLAVRVVLALPDRDLGLEPLQGGAAGVVGGGAVGGADGDRDARLAHGDLAQAVDDRRPEILVGGFEVGHDPAEPLQGHRAVGAVGELLDGPPGVVVAHRAEEDHHGAPAGPETAAATLCDVDGVVGELRPERLLGASPRPAGAGPPRRLPPGAYRRGRSGRRWRPPGAARAGRSPGDRGRAGRADRRSGCRPAAPAPSRWSPGRPPALAKARRRIFMAACYQTERAASRPPSDPGRRGSGFFGSGLRVVGAHRVDPGSNWFEASVLLPAVALLQRADQLVLVPLGAVQIVVGELAPGMRLASPLSCFQRPSRMCPVVAMMAPFDRLGRRPGLSRPPVRSESRARTVPCCSPAPSPYNPPASGLPGRTRGDSGEQGQSWRGVRAAGRALAAAGGRDPRAGGPHPARRRPEGAGQAARAGEDDGARAGRGAVRSGRALPGARPLGGRGVLPGVRRRAGGRRGGRHRLGSMAGTWWWSPTTPR